MKKHEDEALMSLQRIDEAIALYEAEGEEALEEIEKSLTKDEFEVFMDEVEELLEDDEDDEGFEDEDDLERVDEMAYAKPKIEMEDVYCIPITTLKLFMLDFEKGENLGRLKKADEFKFIIELKSAYPGSGFIEESDIAHDKWEQYDVLVELFDKVHQRLMDFCRLSGNKNFMPYSFVLKKQSLSTDDTDILIRADTNEYNENRTADINIPYKKNIEKRVDNLLMKHKLNTIIHC